MVSALTAADLGLQARQWVPEWKRLGGLPPEASWDWADFLERSLDEPLRHRCYAMKHDGLLDGLLYVSFQPAPFTVACLGGDVTASDADLVYVEYVCAAPSPAVKGVAVAFIRVAARLAQEASAVVGLHSKTEALHHIYGKVLGMHDRGEHQLVPPDGPMHYFEGDAQWLARWRTS